MPRHPEPRYYRSRDAWYAQVQGRKILLAKGRASSKEAWAVFHRMMADPNSGVFSKTKPIGLVELADRFLDEVQRNLASTTYVWYRNHLQSFVEVSGHLQADAIRPLHVQAWLDRHAGWSSSTCHGAITAAKRLTSWAKAQGYIEVDRLAGMPRPGIAQRAATMTEGEIGQIFGSVKDRAFLDLLTILKETGCRPSEAMRLEASMIDVKGRAAILGHSKTSAKTGRPRVIFLTPKAMAVLERLAREHPEGPLLRNRAGRPWNRNAVRLRFRGIRRRLGLGPGATAEAFRHGYATDALERGVPIATVAELLGHRGTRMIEAYYSHLHDRREHLRDAAGIVRPDEDDVGDEDA